MLYVLSPEGVNVALYEVPDPEKLLITPLFIVISELSKFVVTSFEINNKLIDALLDLLPFATVLDVIVILGAVVSIEKLPTIPE